ncbi:MAG TPA: FHA domain-containing protein, partial [Polyangiaceae bacterium]|nr:FHA domain-containing protein [Polyangiaceae bacterium]
MGRDGARAREAARLEDAGELGAAVEAWIEAELGDEAARVLMLRADAEASLEKRVAYLERAARVAEDEAVRRRAKGRKAKLGLDLIKQKGAAAKSEIAAVALDLESAGEARAAAEAFRLAGDREGEVRALTAAGAIDELEERLGEDAERAHRENTASLARNSIEDLDRGGERVRALERAREALRAGPDERVDALARSIRQRLARGPTLSLTWDGVSRVVALGDEVTVGRGEATIVVPSRAVSRVHLRLKRVGAAIVVEDAGTRNGTFLRGARLGAAVSVGDGIVVELGGSVPCEITPAGAGVDVAIAGGRWHAPLGPLAVGPWRVALTAARAEEPATVTLSSTEAAPAFLGPLEAARALDLCYGDAIASERGGAATLVVGAPAEPGA